jgi:hypothetical protein
VRKGRFFVALLLIYENVVKAAVLINEVFPGMLLSKPVVVGHDQPILSDIYPPS